MGIIAENKEQYQKEQDQLLKTVLEYRFFNPWKNLTKYAYTKKSLQLDSNLDLYITSTCNQKCEYCYLQKYPQLYPKEYNKPEIILHNLELLLQYIQINNYNIPCCSIFSGDIWQTQFGWNVLEMIYKYVKNGVKFGYILLPTNCSFISDSIATQKMQQIINKFKDIGCPLVISISIDGKIVDSSGRPRNDKNNPYTDEFYERLGAFAHYNDFLFHPMIAPHNVKYWRENYEWWMKYLKYYEFPPEAIMMLEVRNGDWTDENIEDYCEFITYLLDIWLKDKCNNDPQKFADYISHSHQISDDLLSGYYSWLIGLTDTYIGCTITNHLQVRLGDLAITPCHRTSYKEYLYGYLNVENNRITGIRAVNPTMAIKILMNNILVATPLCDKCPINLCCLKGCFGSQIEYGKDPFFPLSNVCKFFKRKYATIFKYYREHGIIYYLQQIGPDVHCSDYVAKLLQINDKIGDNIDELGEI